MRTFKDYIKFREAAVVPPLMRGVDPKTIAQVQNQAKVDANSPMSKNQTAASILNKAALQVATRPSGDPGQVEKLMDPKKVGPQQPMGLMRKK